MSRILTNLTNISWLMFSSEHEKDLGEGRNDDYARSIDNGCYNYQEIRENNHKIKGGNLRNKRGN